MLEIEEGDHHIIANWVTMVIPGNIILHPEFMIILSINNKIAIEPVQDIPGAIFSNNLE